MPEAPPAPDLTVVVPTKDRPTMLPGALESVLGQVEDVEVVVVDDGSAPANARTIRDACADPRVRLVRNERAHGAPHGRNQGLRLARGRYWATLDDDDRWLPGKWKAQWALLEEHGFPPDLVVVTAIRTSYGGRPGREVVPAVRDPERPATLRELFRRVPISAFLNSYVVPTELMRRVGGYDDRLVWGEHTDVLIRLWGAARFAGTDHVGVLVERGHEQAASRVGRNWGRKVEGIELLLDKHAREFAREPELRSLYRHVLAVSQLRAGDRWGAARTFAGVALTGSGLARRARAAGDLAVTAVGGPALWTRLARLRGSPVDSVL